MSRIVTCTAPVNIAVIKYWGKKNESLIIPLNDSISFSLCQEDMHAKTTVCISQEYSENKFLLNGEEVSMDNPRIKNCLDQVKKLARQKDKNDSDHLNWKIHICSENNFPTAAGLASSAAGYACLVSALAKLFGLDSELSSIARHGSGSACRSVYGGMVRWYRGIADDGSDSIAEPIAPVDHWGNLHVIICVASENRKKTSSTEGMRRSWETSSLMKFRVEKSVPARIEKMMKAIMDKNWNDFCDLTMSDSNEMHAVCLDTFPPCVYMNDTSHAITSLVHFYNQRKTDSNLQDHKICYTFDAGPNACLFIPEVAVKEVATLLQRRFPQNLSADSTGTYWRGKPTLFDENVVYEMEPSTHHSLKYFIHTTVGGGPRFTSDHLIDEPGQMV